MGKRITLAAIAAMTANACSSEIDVDCFVRGTRIRTPSGQKPIEELAIGDEVLSFDPETMSIVVRRVEALLRAQTERVVTIEVAGRRIVTTDEHPFWDAEKRAWTRAGDLREGCVLALIEDGHLVPRTITRTASTARSEPVFNLTVEGPEHTYFAEDVGVHNKMVVGPCLDACIERSGIGVRNDSSAAFAIDVRQLAGTASIDDRILTRELALEIPESAISSVADAGRTLEIQPGNVVGVGAGSKFDIIRNGAPTAEPRGAVMITIGGVSNLYIGKGILITRREEGVLRLVPEDATRLRVVPIRKDAPLCAPPPVAIPDLPQLPHGDVSLSGLKREGGCTSVNLSWQTLQFCAPAEAWPFEDGSVVKLTSPRLLAREGASGLRLEHADRRAFEIVRLRTPSTAPLALGTRQLALVEDASCFLPPRPTPAGKAACNVVRVRTTARDLADESLFPFDASVDIEGGRAWISSAQSTPIALDCAGKWSGNVDVELVARTNP